MYERFGNEFHYFNNFKLDRCCLNETQQKLFEQIALYCEQFANFIPMSFVLGM